MICDYITRLDKIERDHYYRAHKELNGSRSHDHFQSISYTAAN